MSASTRLVMVLLGSAALLIPVLPSASDASLLQCVVEAGSVAVAWRHLARRPEVLRDGWALLVSAVTLLAVSDAVAWLEGQVRHPSLRPAPSSVLALVGYVLLGVAALRLERSRRLRRRTPGGIETAIFASGVLTPVLVFLIVPVASEQSLPLGARAAAIAYAVADLVVVSVIARLVVTAGARSRSVAYLGTALVSVLAGDLWSWLQSGEINTSSSPVVRMLWAWGYVLFAAGVAHPSMASLSSAEGGSGDVSRSRRVWLMGVGQSLPAVTLLIGLVFDTDPSLPIIAAGGLLVSILVTARVNGLLDRIGKQSTRLAGMARLDDLTGLVNRRAWRAELPRACAAAAAGDRPLAIAVMDLDLFKTYNDTFGHPAGDRLLQLAAEQWTSALRPGEVLARYGGEEFAVLLPDHGAEQAVARLDAMRALTPGGQTLSAGVATWCPGADPEQTMADADAALYAAKRAGRDRVVAFDPHLRDAPALPHALRTVVQPIVRTCDLSVVAYEALSRFDPGADVEAVFDQAHTDGYGDILESSAILSALRVPDRPVDVRVFVNVSERAMRSDWFWQTMPLSLHHVVMELHERRPGLDVEVLAQTLDRFRSRGALICLHGVTADPSDLDRMVALAPDLIKVHPSLVTGCDGGREQVAALRRLLEVAEACQVRVCAEGVETLAELQVLCDLGVPLLQGFLLGHPEPHWVEPLAPALRVRDSRTMGGRPVSSPVSADQPDVSRLISASALARAARSHRRRPCSVWNSVGPASRSRSTAARPAAKSASTTWACSERTPAT